MSSGHNVSIAIMVDVVHVEASNVTAMSGAGKVYQRPTVPEESGQVST